ncbi:putative glutamate receptor [Oratosquilla oratoria]|uniref:putative glutamate receptor n=1 Tax=Oratosquilla oratoria TaxID=337810 RepID=UPI003F75A8FC
MHPHKYVLWLGPENQAYHTLGHNTLRNTANVLYIAIQPTESILPQSSPKFLPADLAQVTVSKILTRCLYCNSGDPSIYRLHVWRPDTGFRPGIPLFRDQLKQFYGHTFRVMTLSWFPFVELKENPEDPKGPLLPVDSLDTRIAASMAKIINFTAAYRLPEDGKFGYPTSSGNWTGIVGQLQYYKTDFSNVLSVNEGRSKVVDFSVSYPGEPIVMILSAPRPLPQWTALMRPFEIETWLATLVSVSVVGLVLYLLQKGWSLVAGRPGLRLDVAFLQVWAIILEDPPTNQPTNASGQMIIGWWWVYCMLITIVYKSALTSHLTIPGKSPTIDTYEQLLAQEGWTWGTEPSYGSGWEFFKTSTNPTIMAIFKGLEVAKFDEQMKRVFAGHHAFFSWKYYVQYNLAARYGDAFGNTPTYRAQEETVVHTGYSWGFRRGAPFRKRFDQLMLRLLQAGLIEYWLDELIITRARHERNLRKEKEAKEGVTESNVEVQQEDDGNVVLSLHHLQGAFYILMIGSSLSLIVLGVEIALHICKL